MALSRHYSLFRGILNKSSIFESLHCYICRTTECSTSFRAMIERFVTFWILVKINGLTNLSHKLTFKTWSSLVWETPCAIFDNLGCSLICFCHSDLHNCLVPFLTTYVVLHLPTFVRAHPLFTIWRPCLECSYDTMTTFLSFHRPFCVLCSHLFCVHKTHPFCAFTQNASKTHSHKTHPFCVRISSSVLCSLLPHYVCFVALQLTSEFLLLLEAISWVRRSGVQRSGDAQATAWLYGPFAHPWNGAFSSFYVLQLVLWFIQFSPGFSCFICSWFGPSAFFHTRLLADLRNEDAYCYVKSIFQVQKCR